MHHQHRNRCTAESHPCESFHNAWRYDDVPASAVLAPKASTVNITPPGMESAKTASFKQSTRSLRIPCRTSSVTPRDRSLSTQENPDRKSKKIRFFRNGDHFFGGLTVTIQSDQTRTLTALMKDLTRLLDDKIFMPHGVRFVMALDGMTVTSLDNLHDGQSYVCSSTDTLKRLDYLSIKGSLQLANEDILKRRSYADPRSSRGRKAAVSTLNLMTPKRVMMFLNGPKPRKLMRLLLDERTTQSFLHVLDEITNFFSPLPGPIRKVFDIELGECQTLADFFSGEVFVASVSGRVARADLDLDLEEQKLLMKRKAHTRNGRNAYNGAYSNAVTARDFSASPRLPRRMTLPRQSEMITSCFNINHPPDIRDRYNVGRAISNGNFASVHECIEWRTGRPVAIKIIERNKIRDKKSVGNEINILRGLKHPNIVNLLDEYTFAGRLYVVMELVKGGDLFSLLSENTKFSETEAAELIRSLCQALDYLHRSSVVHRDVKPENLLVTHSVSGARSLKLADFGLAAQIKKGEVLTQICGSPTYVAPEILIEAGYGAKVDIWATGVTLFILLCGYPPFQSDAEDQEVLFGQILSGQFEFRSPYWDPISEGAKDLVRQLINVDVDGRLIAQEASEHEWIKTNCRQKSVRESSTVGSCSNDSGIQIDLNSLRKVLKVPQALSVSSTSSPSPVSPRQVKFVGGDAMLSPIVGSPKMMYSSVSVSDLPTEISAHFWDEV